MADLPHRCHGNFPQRRATLLPREAGLGARLALEAMSSETGPDLATAAEEPIPLAEQLSITGSSEMEKETNQSSNGKTRVASPSSDKRERRPHKSVQAFMKTIRINPEAQRILGNSCIAVVSLERLNFQSVYLSSLQPVVTLVRLPGQTRTELHNDLPLNGPQQNGFSPNEAASWTEPICSDSSPSGEPEQDSGFDCDSNPDHPYIVFDSASDNGKSDSETFYLDPDPDQTIVIELEPEAEADRARCLQLEEEPQNKCEVDIVDDSEDQRPDLCCSQEQADLSIVESEAGPGAEELESEDFCAVCLNGGDLLCCDRCPKVYHLACHIPPLISFPLGDWVCTLCRTDQEPVEAYDCENMHSCVGVNAPYTLSNQDQRRCEKLTLSLYCHLLSAPFHEPVSPLARNYYQIIKRPIDLSVIRRKLDKSNTLHYFTAEQFVDDILLMFKNCATFNYPDSEVGQAGRSLEVFFLSKLKEIFPDRTFLSASQDRTDRARIRWISRKKKENYKKKRYIFKGKKYYL